MTRSPLLLICDHKGVGLGRDLSFLGEVGFELVVSQGLRASLQRLRNDAPDLVVVDPLAAEGSVELSAIDAARGDEPPTPLLVLVERDDAEAATRVDRALSGQAWDLLTRGASREEVQLRIRRLLDQVDLVHEMGELRHRASHDDRTDLLRPQAFQKRLVEHFSAAQRHNHDMALVLIDLDGFGAINKLYDHMVGDALIARVGDVIRKALRVEDVAGRLGGDEFAVVLPYTGKINAAQVVNRLKNEILQLSGSPEGFPGEVAISASIGFETFDGEDLDSVDKLRRHAERALRTAKRQGGDRGVYYRSLPLTEEPG